MTRNDKGLNYSLFGREVQELHHHRARIEHDKEAPRNP